jgi:hypothetical protein
VPELPITLAVSIVPIGLGRAIAASLTLAVGMGVLLRWRAAIWQTTLQSAWWWSLAALLAWSLVELSAVFRPSAAGSTTFAAFRAAAISLSLCPVIALLGAKRPQVGPWNFVVLSLWGILILPAAEGLLLHPGQPILLGTLRSWFAVVPVLLLVLNYGGTRFWLAVLLLAGGQLSALSAYGLPHFPVAPDVLSIAGLVMTLLALVAAHCTTGKRRPADLDHLWFDFRDAFGAFWALRVIERMNAAARQHGWNTDLAWSGFHTQDARPLPDSSDLAAEQLSTFKGLLRRFVSTAWIEQRLKKIAALPPEEQSG